MDTALTASALSAHPPVVPFTRYHVGKEYLRHPVVTSQSCEWRSIITHEHAVCGELRHAAGTRLLAWDLFCPWHVCSDDTSSKTVGVSTRVVPPLSHSATQARFPVSQVVLPVPADSCSKPIDIWVLLVAGDRVADVSAFTMKTPPVRSDSIRLPVLSVKIVHLN